jgi:hypothetical protein
VSEATVAEDACSPCFLGLVDSASETSDLGLFQFLLITTGDPSDAVRKDSVVLRAPTVFAGPQFLIVRHYWFGPPALSIAHADFSPFPSPVSPNPASFPALLVFSLRCNCAVVLGRNYPMLLGSRSARSFFPCWGFFPSALTLALCKPLLPPCSGSTSAFGLSG